MRRDLWIWALRLKQLLQIHKFNFVSNFIRDIDLSGSNRCCLHLIFVLPWFYFICYASRPLNFGVRSFMEFVDQLWQIFIHISTSTSELYIFSYSLNIYRILSPPLFPAAGLSIFILDRSLTIIWKRDKKKRTNMTPSVLAGTIYFMTLWPVKF